MKKKVERQTKETKVVVELDVGSAKGSSIKTDNLFLKHMLTTLFTFSGFELKVETGGDLEHHLVEDVAITLGRALRESLDGLPAIKRISTAIVPMDDALVLVSLDVIDRAYASIDLPDTMYRHFFRSLATEAKITLHIKVLDGFDQHHVIEAAFKGVGLALKEALTETEKVMSTKGKAAIKK